MSVNLKGYSTIGTNNKEAAETFYDALLAQLEPKKLLANDRITMWLSKEDGSVILAIAIPYDGNTAHHGNGTMKAIALGSHDEVISMYDKAIELGAKDDGAPGAIVSIFIPIAEDDIEVFPAAFVAVAVNE